jgi:hypothetical protein
LIACSTSEYQIYYQSHTVAGRDLVSVARGVLSGHPPWKAFQARLLGPLAFSSFGRAVIWLRTASPLAYTAFVRIFSLPDTRDLAVLDGFVALMLVIKNVICFGLLRKTSGSVVKATGGTLLGSVLFIVTTNYWLYTWDLFELIFFCFLAYLIFRRSKPGVLFFVVYALALTNRESAAFFGIWLVCFATASWIINRRFLWRECAIGIVLIAIAILYVQILRQSLLVESTLGHEAAESWGTSALQLGQGAKIHQAFGNHLLFLENLKIFAKNLVSTHFYVDVLLIALVGHGIAVVRLGIKWQKPQVLAIGIFNLFLLVCIVNFAILNETRLFLICIPFVVFSSVTFGKDLVHFFTRIDSAEGPSADGLRPISFDRNGGSG